MKRKIQQKTANNQQLKAQSSKLKSALIFFKKNYFLFIIVGCVGFVGVVAFYKLFISKPTYVYAKIKVGQGLWWASTQKPSLWFIKAIQQAKEQKDLTGKPLVTLISTTYYPYYGSSQYDVYITVKLKVSVIGKTGTYSFNRETIGVSSPIDLEFPNVQFSGTIIEISNTPIYEVTETKIVYLYKKNVNPWEYDQIQIGDFLSNGKENIFKVLAKERGETNDVLLSDLGKQINWDTEPYRYVKIKAIIKVKKEDGNYVFGEEAVVSPGRGLSLVLNNLTLNDYTIIKIE